VSDDGEQPRRPFVIGLTGNVACGKSTVLRMLADLGAGTIDADTVYHELIAPGAPLQLALRRRFGADIIASDGTLDRRALGAIVFRDPAALADLDALTHPAVVAEVRSRIARCSSDVVVVDAVKLIESGLGADCDRIWLVTCRPDQQVERLMARNGLDRAEAERRVAAQPPPDAKSRLVDIVVDNSDTIDSTRAQVVRAWGALGLPRRVESNTR
jgi:dephospho-CoA kinase